MLAIVGGARGCELSNYRVHPASVEMRDVVGFPHMLWAAGDYIYPALGAFEDSDFCFLRLGLILLTFP